MSSDGKFDKTTFLRYSMLYEFQRGTGAVHAWKNFKEVFGQDTPSNRTVLRWFARFRDGNFDVSDLPRSGRPSEIDDAVLREFLESETSLTSSMLAEKFEVDESTIRRHMQKLGFILKLDVWVPHELSEANKNARVSICRTLLSRYETDRERDGRTILERLVAGDEKWICYQNVQRKRTWLPRGAKNLPGTSAKPGLHPKKVLLSVWWDIRGVIFFELLPRNETINADKYCEQLLRLRSALAEKRPALLNRRRIIFHHDNARPHTAQKTKKLPQDLSWEVLDHPPYSPDIAPSDFHLFRGLQNYLNGKSFRTEAEVKVHLEEYFFRLKNETFYRRGIEKLPGRWKEIIDNGGAYITD